MKRLRAASLFSGIGAPELACPQWDWRWCAEIDPFASAVMAHHHPKQRNLGDVTKVDWESVRRSDPVDVVVFGSPCTDFSVAGQRAGMDGADGNLALVALGIIRTLRPRFFIFENVPGMLSSTCHQAPDPSPPPDPVDMEREGQTMDCVEYYGAEELHAFNSFLAEVSAIRYGFAWRIFDAQYAGLAQRRQRVFLVGCAGEDWRTPAAILLDSGSLRWNPAPRRGTGQAIATTLSAGAGKRGGAGIDNAQLARPIAGHHSRNDNDNDTYVAQTLRAGQDKLGVDVVMSAMRANGEAHSGFESGDGILAFDTTQITSKANRSQPRIAVRRLTPLECERLMGVPDYFTLINYRGKPAADSPRYRALGNSMAVPCVAWIGKRLDMVREVLGCG